MYDIRQFRPALYLLIVLGMTGFALASGSPGLWVLAVGATLLNAWLIHTDRFRPLPRFLANIITLGSLVYVVFVVSRAVGTPILVVGQFLVFLQIVKLYEQRANRDYAQLIVLSLLLVVAAAISTARLDFGIVLILYLFLSLYVCLLFHLKVESDYAKQAIGVAEERINPETLRQDQRYLSRSMRRLTGLVSAVAIVMAVVVFLFFPRGAGSNLLGSLQFRPGDTLTGFHDQLSFQNVARITQNHEIVAHVNVWHNDQPLTDGRSLLLRGKTLQIYNGKEGPGGAWQWLRSAANSAPRDLRPGATTVLDERSEVQGTDRFRQRITLDPTGTPVLFALPGVAQITPASAQLDGRVIFSREDQAIQSSEPLYSRVTYEVISTDRLIDAGPRTETRETFNPYLEITSPAPMPSRSRIDPRIEEFARRDEVSGSDAQGPLASRREPGARVTPLDADIAHNIERYLRSNFQYTLDLTDAARAAGEDPMVAFLYNFRRGHCEYFAGAMTLMCQSLGMQARIVIGFKSDEFNEIGGYYIVRQSHAHAWVEVLGDDGRWYSFDPTSSQQTAQGGITWWQRMQHLFNFLEFKWANSVVAYDRESRTNILRATENQLVNTATRNGERLTQAKEWVAGDNAVLFSSRFITVLISLMIAGLISAILWYAVERWRLRRRARRIGIDDLPAADQMRLAKQLGFYDELLRLLERHRIHRPRHLTQMEFCQSIAFVPAQAFDAIRRLTQIFYRVRFGEAQLNARQQARLHHSIAIIEQALQTN